MVAVFYKHRQIEASLEETNENHKMPYHLEPFNRL